MEIITITLSMEKVTKNCIKFVENTLNEFVPEKLGSLYMQKSYLAGLGYNGGQIVLNMTANAEICDENDITFVPEKATKNTWKFNEESVSEFVPEKIGSLYVPKSTLAELGYTGGNLYVSVTTENSVVEK